MGPVVKEKTHILQVASATVGVLGRERYFS